MATSDVSANNSFFDQIESVRAELRKKVARAHQVLQGRESALLSELQQLEDSYRAERVNNNNLFKEYVVQITPNLDKDRIRRIDLEWEEKLEGMLSSLGSIRVGKYRLQGYKRKSQSTIGADKQIKTRKYVSIQVKRININGYCLSTYKNENFIIPVPSSENIDPLLIDDPTSSQEYASAPTSPNSDHYGGSPPSPPLDPLANFTSKALVNDTSHTNTLPKHAKEKETPSYTEDEPTRGLRNTRSTCYMNSILQCLSHTLPLREFYVSDEYKQFLNKRGDLSSAFKRVMLELWDSTSQHSVDPYVLRREVKARTDRFPDYTQHDAHEFMRFLLNELHEEINRASVETRKSPADNETLREACARHLTWEDSRISELFGGMLRSEVCCSVCSDKSIVYIPFLDIALPIPRTRKRRPGSSCPTVHLSDCYRIFSSEETLDKEERPFCSKCSDPTISTKQLSIDKSPQLLVIQLKLFSHYPKRKMSTHVEFDDTWSFEDYANNTHTYSLYGIVCHFGTLRGGHYTAFCKYNGTWRCFNDSQVTSVPWEHVKKQDAYILFYTK